MACNCSIPHCGRKQRSDLEIQGTPQESTQAGDQRNSRISANETPASVEEVGDRWKSPVPDKPLGMVGSVKQITIESARAVEEVPEWEELEIAVDSGASVTVIGRDMVKAVEAKGARPDIKYEVADGSQIEHLGEKTFTAYIDSGLEHYLTAQVTEVNKALLSVSKIVGKGCKVVFDREESYIENKSSGEWIPLEERNGMYVLKMWIGKDQSHPF